jgi:hypothetical protein
MLSYFQNEELMSAYRMSAFGDRKVLSETPIHSRSVGAWRNVLTVDEVAMALDALGSDPFTVMGYDEVLREALALTGRDRTAISAGGRRAEYVADLSDYPACNARALGDDPSLWPRASGYTSSTALERVFQESIREKEMMIERLAEEADSRLSLLRESEASVSAVRQALAARVESARALAAEADHRLELLNAAEAARAQLESELQDAHRALEQKEELLRRITDEAERRLEMLDAARASLAHVGERLLEAHEALDEKETVLRALHVEAELRLQLLLQSDVQRRLLEQKLAEIPAPDGA